MLKSDKIKIELSQHREKVGDVKNIDSWSRKNKELEQAYQAALTHESAERAALGVMDTETLEKQALLHKASVGDFVKSLLVHKPVVGASAEARAAFGCIGEYEVPLELFEPAGKQKAVTPAPATGERPIDVKPVQPHSYQRTVAGNEGAGIDMPNVGGGEQAFPVLTTGTPASMKGKDGAADSTAAAITIHKAEAKRLTGSYVVRVEDMAMFPQLEGALRQDIPRSIANTLDQQLLAGSGSGAQLASLFSLLTDPTADQVVETFATFISTITGNLDGLHAYELADLRALVGMKTYEKMTELFAVNTAVSAADYLHNRIGGLRASKRIPAPVSDNQDGIVRLGMESMVAVAPVWGGIQLIDDPYTNAAKGQRTITAFQLVSDVLLLRPDAFKQVDFHLA